MHLILYVFRGKVTSIADDFCKNHVLTIITCMIMPSTVDLRMMLLYLLKMYVSPGPLVSFKVRSLYGHFFRVYRANVRSYSFFLSFFPSFFL